MKLIIGGCRGTSPVAQQEFMKFGGETTAFLIEGAAGERVLVDAGSGVRELGRRLDGAAGVSSLLMLFTHYHLDHVAGLPSLGLIYCPNWLLEIASPNRGAFRVGDVIPRVMHRPFWPLQVEDLKSRIQFTALRGPVSRKPRKYGGLRIRWCEVHHPDGCTAYRIDEPATGASCVIATDMEWGASSEIERERFLQLCREPSLARLVLMDGHYCDEEYAEFKGWGHSTWQDVVRVAKETGVKKTLVVHHSPTKNDGQLEELESRIKRKQAGVSLARERMEIDLGAL